jgi:hypothetical protein
VDIQKRQLQQETIKLKIFITVPSSSMPSLNSQPSVNVPR